MREEISRLLAVHPFDPFSIFVCDGTRSDFSHPDQVL